ncbi:2,3-diphosphoglycerate dependent phosphoglycerate mutase 2 (plasmid) [Rhizobium sp. CIAT894]|uniref:2,3-bisphosphoglycerate-dependent phosphoglycerate mutase n=1 Tax=unclassified Rhizobium TaxID=2613769 RepID=UPI000A1E9AA5|nr:MULTISPECIES: 2,3-bisphosphoglycerate-dependent phosphoglycerate mutase [unclassified Rhizobium]ARM91222.1 2,3-diphosphoglycerate dependent phosphoglycerate mutase 2 [Rhizobium sp. CIAT894]PDT07241.1 2,3-bisphosphoglycerate-dependent phosphoglycerate mutase [Rhizobium sp. M1]
MSTLVIVRHGQSEGNARGEFTGTSDVPLTQEGWSESRRAGSLLANLGISFDIAFSSALLRTVDTCRAILNETNGDLLEPIRRTELNERDYGQLTGINKNVARERWGQDVVQVWRRSYSTPPPGGESIRDISARVLPFLISEVFPALLRGKSVLVVAHGNTIRSLKQGIERLTIQDTLAIESPTAAPTVYRIASDLSIIEKTNVLVGTVC